MNNIKEKANYCIGCINKPCSKACPLNNDTAGFIKLIKLRYPPVVVLGILILGLQRSVVVLLSFSLLCRFLFRRIVPIPLTSAKTEEQKQRRQDSRCISFHIITSKYLVSYTNIITYSPDDVKTALLLAKEEKFFVKIYTICFNSS